MSDKNWRIGVVARVYDDCAIVLVEHMMYAYVRFDESQKRYSSGQLLLFKYLNSENKEYEIDNKNTLDISSIIALTQSECQGPTGSFDRDIWSQKWRNNVNNGIPFLVGECFVHFDSIEAYIEEHHTDERILLKNWILHNTSKYQELSITLYDNIIQDAREYVESIDINEVIESYKIEIDEVFQNPPGKDAYYVASKESSINTNDEYIKSLFPSFSSEIISEESPIYFSDYTPMTKEQKAAYYAQINVNIDNAKKKYSKESHINFVALKSIQKNEEIRNRIIESDLETFAHWPILHLKRFRHVNAYYFERNKLIEMVKDFNEDLRKYYTPQNYYW